MEEFILEAVYLIGALLILIGLFPNAKCFAAEIVVVLFVIGWPIVIPIVIAWYGVREKMQNF